MLTVHSDHVRTLPRDVIHHLFTSHHHGAWGVSDGKKTLVLRVIELLDERPELLNILVEHEQRQTLQHSPHLQWCKRALQSLVCLNSG